MTQPQSSPVTRGLEGQLHVASGKPHHHHHPRCFICRMGGSLTVTNPPPPPRPRPSQSPTRVLLPGIARVSRTRANLLRAGLWHTRAADRPWAGLLYRDLVSGEGRGRGSREAVRGSRSGSSARQAQRLCARPAAAILNRVSCGAF